MTTQKHDSEKMRARTKRLARRQRKQFTNMVESSEFRSAPTIEIDATKMHELLAASPPSSSNAKTFWEDEVVSRAMEFVTNEFDDDEKDYHRLKERTMISRKTTTRGLNARAKRAAIEFSAAIAIGTGARLRKDTKIAFET